MRHGWPACRNVYPVQATRRDFSFRLPAARHVVDGLPVIVDGTQDPAEERRVRLPILLVVLDRLRTGR